MQTRKNANLAPESFRHSAVPRRLKHRARRRRRILCLLPVILVFGVLAAALLRFTPAFAYADIFPAQATTRRIKDVPYISQLPTLPTDCESASAAMLLNYYGCTVTAEEFASYYLPTGDAPHTDENGELIGCDPWEAFPGDPFSETGWGCYSTVIERAMNEFLTNTGYHAERLSGVPLYRLKSYIDNNTPVMIWATICMEPPIESDIWTVPETGREITWVYPMHALVLTGYDENGYYFSDPLAGQDIYYGKDSVEVAYTALFEQAIILTN